MKIEASQRLLSTMLPNSIRERFYTDLKKWIPELVPAKGGAYRVGSWAAFGIKSGDYSSVISKLKSHGFIQTAKKGASEVYRKDRMWPITIEKLSKSRVRSFREIPNLVEKDYILSIPKDDGGDYSKEIKSMAAKLFEGASFEVGSQKDVARLDSKKFDSESDAMRVVEVLLKSAKRNKFTFIKEYRPGSSASVAFFLKADKWRLNIDLTDWRRDYEVSATLDYRPYGPLPHDVYK